LARPNSPRHAEAAQPASRLRAHLARARAALENNLYRDAEGEFRRVLALDGKHAGALAGLSHALSGAGKFTAAEAAAKRAIAAAPGDAQLHLRVGQLLARHRRSGAAAEAALREAVRLDPGKPTAVAAFARVLAERDKGEEAIAVLRSAAAQLPESVGLRLQLAHHLEEQHGLAEAAQLYREILEEKPDEARAQAGLRRTRDPSLIFGLFESLLAAPDDLAALEQLAGELGVAPQAAAALVRFAKNPGEEQVPSLASTPLDRELLTAVIRAAERQSALSETGAPAPYRHCQIASEATDPLGLRASHENWTPAQWLCAFVLRRSRPARRTAVVTAFRDEGLSILEWVAHYRVLGFDTLFIYSNDNADGSEELLRLLAGHGIVTYVENRIGVESRNDGKLRYSPQIKAYGHALHLLPELWEHEWALFVDGDEFLIPDERYSFEIGRVIDAAIARFPGRPPSAICFHWLSYVSSAYAWDPRPLLRRFVHAEPRRNLKSLVLLRDTLSMQLMHFPKLVPDRFAVRANLVPLENHRWRGIDPVLEGGHINHYWTKSFEEFSLKKARGNAMNAAMFAEPVEGNAGARARTKSENDVFAPFFSKAINGGETSANYAPPPEALVLAVEREIERLSALPGVAAAVADIRENLPKLAARFDRQGGLRRLYEEGRASECARHKQAADATGIA
jgi:tetratricopeptide (TPR) repeat protein